MAVSGTRSIALGFSGDVNAPSLVYNAADNASSPGDIDVQTLASGANTITPPSGATAVTIIPPDGNLETITLKGIAGDTGVVIHKTDPSSFGLNSAASTFVLAASGTITGIRFIWT